jgi:hypothetical protein
MSLKTTTNKRRSPREKALSALLEPLFSESICAMNAELGSGLPRQFTDPEAREHATVRDFLLIHYTISIKAKKELLTEAQKLVHSYYLPHPNAEYMFPTDGWMSPTAPVTRPGLPRLVRPSRVPSIAKTCSQILSDGGNRKTLNRPVVLSAGVVSAFLENGGGCSNERSHNRAA